MYNSSDLRRRVQVPPLRHSESTESTDCAAVNEDASAYVGQQVAFLAKFRSITNSVGSDGNSLQVISTFQCVEPNGMPINPTGMPRAFALEGDGGVAMSNPFSVFEVSGTVKASLTGSVEVNLERVPGNRNPLLENSVIKPFSQ